MLAFALDTGIFAGVYTVESLLAPIVMEFCRVWSLNPVFQALLRPILDYTRPYEDTLSTIYALCRNFCADNDQDRRFAHSKRNHIVMLEYTYPVSLINHVDCIVAHSCPDCAWHSRLQSLAPRLKKRPVTKFIRESFIEPFNERTIYLHLPDVCAVEVHRFRCPPLNERKSD
jgi:hypothetical protein